MTKEGLDAQPRILTVVLPADYDNQYLWDLVDMATSAGFELRLTGLTPSYNPPPVRGGGILPSVYGDSTIIGDARPGGVGTVTYNGHDTVPRTIVSNRYGSDLLKPEVN